MGKQGSTGSMPRAALPSDSGRAETVIWGVSFAIASVFAVGQIVTVIAASHAAIAFYESSGTAPALVDLASKLGPLGISVVLTLINAFIYALFVWLGRRYWIGFAYVPPVIYLGMGSVIVWLMVAGAVSAFVTGG